MHACVMASGGGPTVNDDVDGAAVSIVTGSGSRGFGQAGGSASSGASGAASAAAGAACGTGMAMAESRPCKAQGATASTAVLVERAQLPSSLRIRRRQIRHRRFLRDSGGGRYLPSPVPLRIRRRSNPAPPNFLRNRRREIFRPPTDPLRIRRRSKFSHRRFLSY